jgi:hypothetical protein
MAAKKIAAQSSISQTDTATKIAALRAEFSAKMKGKAVIDTANRIWNISTTHRLPPGILSLDIGLGGWFPAGGLSQIAGERS